MEELNMSELNTVGGGRINVAITGISGGVFGAYGWITGYCWRERAQLPAQFWTTVLLFSILNISVATLLSVKVSLTTHLVGFALGAAIGLLGWGGKQQSVQLTRARDTGSHKVE